MKAVRGLLPALPQPAWAVLGGTAVSAVGSGLTLPFLLVYLSRVRGIPVATAGLAVAVVAFASFVGNPLGGSLSDRLGGRRTVVLGLVISACGAVGVALVREAWHAFAATAVVGLGASITWPAQDSLLATVVPANQRSAVFAVRHATLNAGYGVGGLLAAVVVNLDRPGTFVWLYLANAASFLLFIPVLVGVRSLREATRSYESVVRPASSGGYRAVFRDRVFLRVWALTALIVTVGYGQYTSSFPAFATRPGGIGARALALVVAANTITVVVSQLVVLRVVHGWRRTRAVALLCLLWAATWGITLGAGALGGGAGAVAAFAGAMVLFAVGETLLTPTIPAIVNDLAPDEIRGRYNGVAVLAWTTGFMAGPALAGLALSADRATELFTGLVVACVIAVAAALRLERHLPAALNRIGAAPPADVAPTKAESSTPSAVS